MMHGRNFELKFMPIWKTISVVFKYLDAREDLSIQVHPNDELAKKRHHSFKTEMWYIMQADDDARIIVGFKEKSCQ
jgi:mannose-6-phosphate isomerase